MELLFFEIEEEGSGGGRDNLIAVPIGPITQGEEPSKAKVTFHESSVSSMCKNIMDIK